MDDNFEIKNRQNKMSEYVKTYKEFPDAIKEQAHYLSEKFATHPQIERNERHIMKCGVPEQKIARTLAVVDFFNTYDLLNKRFFDGIYAYDPDGRKVELST